MAGRILANLIVMGGTVLLRAGSQAWRQAIINGQKAGVNAEQAAKTVKGTLCEAEARQILGVDGSTPREEVLKKFQTLYEANEKHGSFYLQSKVFRAMETLDPDVAEMVRPGNVYAQTTKDTKTDDSSGPETPSADRKDTQA